MFTPVICSIYNSDKGFIFEGPDGRKWKEDFDISNGNTSDERELLYTFKEQMKTNHRQHLYYSGIVNSIGNVFIKIFRNGNKEKLVISTDYHQQNVLYTFSKTNPDLKPTKYQIWDMANPGEKISKSLYLNESINETDLHSIISPYWIFWDGTIMESFPAQIVVDFLAEKYDEFTEIIKIIC